MKSRLLGVLAGDDLDPGLLSAWSESADLVWAADGGVNALAPLGIFPDLVIGDLDSAHAWNLEGLQVIHATSQDHTDCDKLLDLAGARGFKEITLTGVEGSQMDHILATLHSCARSSLRVRLALRKGTALVIRGQESLKLAVRPGSRVSLLPLVACEGVSLFGTHWSFEDQRLEPLGFSSISNRTDHSSLSVSMKSGAAVLFIGRERTEMPLWNECEPIEVPSAGI